MSVVTRRYQNHIKKGRIAQTQNLISIDPGVWPEKLVCRPPQVLHIKYHYQQTPTRSLPVAQNKARFPVPTLDTQFSPILFAQHTTVTDLQLHSHPFKDRRQT